MSASPRAAKLCSNWLHFCISIGWSRDKLAALADLWWAHHDEDTGELK